MKSASFLATFSFFLSFTLPAQQPSWQHPPKLVVGIVVDQMRTDYIYRYWDNFGDGGFKRLIGDGAFLRDAHYNYMPTVTGPGHASIYTGTTPSHHGIVANDRYDRTTRKTIYCTMDMDANAVGTAPGNAHRSPVQLLSTTLADELERRTERRSKTIGVALKDRSSILPIGRTGDAAYWMYGTEGSFITSTWYMKQLPQWVIDFNGKKPAEQYLAQTWSLALPVERYHQVLPDDNPYEIPLYRGVRPSLPLNLDSLRKAGAGLDLISYTPWGNTITTDMALAALKGEQMGADAITDLLAISYSSTDILGHRMGPRAVEVEDMYIRLDRELKRLLDELDKSVGAGQYTVFLTADHGAVDVPQYLKDLRGSAGYVDQTQLADSLNYWYRSNEDSLAVWEGQVFVVKRAIPLQHTLTGAYIQQDRMMVGQLMKDPGVYRAWTSSDLRTAAPDGDDLTTWVRNGFMPQRSGDVLFVMRPGHFELEEWSNGHGTTHGSPWTYDTHVPILFYGAGVQHTEVLRRTHITDIVPTISAIVGMSLTDACTGRVVDEVVK
ncbi:MAG: alkaline phosphatase family protein [Flavobacteriales bacterium]|nr:MAG: alkaline phosphatase family protein [Flavobacteriales bacterium]